MQNAMSGYCLNRGCVKKLWRLLCSTLCGLFLLHSPAFAQQAVPGGIAERAAPCIACHGKEGRATSDGSFPRIAGKPSGYLYNQLVNFRDGRRKNAQMNTMIAYMSDQNLKEFADYFASLQPPYPPPQAPTVSPSELERAHMLATQGDPARNIPACTACHGEKLTGTQPSIPGLVGLSRSYLAWQFGSWKDGTRKAAAPDCMAQITEHLTPQDIAALTSWIALQQVPVDMRADKSIASAGAIKLPIACGSYIEQQREQQREKQ